MTTQIATLLEELNSLKAEMGRYKLAIKKLKERSDVIEKQIQGYIQEKNQPGFKYNNTIVTLDSKNKTKRKNKKDKQEAQVEALRKLGISNPNEVIQVCERAGKGDIVKTESIKIKTFKK
jgi:seryl-tRNA synthetase